LIIIALAIGLDAGLPGSSNRNQGTMVPQTTTAPETIPEPGPVTTTQPILPQSAVRFVGDVLLSQDLDFDKKPPQSVGSAGGGADHDIFVVAFSSDRIAITPFSSVAHWNFATTPTKAECADVLTRLNLGGNYSFDHVESGLSFCVRTNEGRIVFARVKDVSSDGYLLHVKSWDK
jgi:hypothetical protein